MLNHHPSTPPIQKAYRPRRSESDSGIPTRGGQNVTAARKRGAQTRGDRIVTRLRHARWRQAWSVRLTICQIRGLGVQGMDRRSRHGELDFLRVRLDCWLRQSLACTWLASFAARETGSRLPSLNGRSYMNLIDATSVSLLSSDANPP